MFILSIKGGGGQSLPNNPKLFILGIGRTGVIPFLTKYSRTKHSPKTRQTKKKCGNLHVQCAIQGFGSIQS